MPGKLIAIALGFVGSALADKLAGAVWRSLTGRPIPNKASSKATNTPIPWRDALLWAALTGMLAAVFRTLAERNAEIVNASLDQRRSAASAAKELAIKDLAPRPYRSKRVSERTARTWRKAGPRPQNTTG